MGWCSHCQDDVRFGTDRNTGFVWCSGCGKVIDQDVNLTGPYFTEDGSRQEVIQADVDDPGVVIQADLAGTKYGEESGAYEDIDIGAMYDGDEYEDYSDGDDYEYSDADGYEDYSDTDF